jgi:hypothetical protein
MISSVDRRSEYVENRAGANVRLNNFLTPYTLDDKSSILNAPCGYSNGVYPSLRPVKTFGPELIDLTQGTPEQPSQWSNITTNSVNFLTGAAGVRYFNITSTQGTLISGKKYSLTLEISNYSGSETLGISTQGNVSVNARLDANGTHSEVFTSDGGFLRIFGRATNSATITLSVKEVIDADFDFTRGSAATRVTKDGLIKNVQILSDELVQNGDFEQIGSELITNGDFATDLSGWIADDINATNRITWESNGARFFCTNQNIGLSQQNVLTIGKAYKLTCDVNVTTGSIGLDGAILVGGSTVNLVNGFNEIYFVANSTTFKIKRTSTVSDCLLDNVSVKEVGQNWTFGTGWSMGDGVAICDGTQSSNSNLQSSTFDFSGNTKVRLSFDVVDYSAGNLAASITGTGQADLTGINSIGTYSVIAVSSAGSRYVDFTADANFVGSIDNISLIEITDDTDLPRIDYTDGTGSLLLEPQSTNLQLRSQEFDNPVWSAVRAVLTANDAISPDGTLNAYKLTHTSGSNGYVFDTIPTVNSGDSRLISVFAKYIDDEVFKIVTFTDSGNAVFNLLNGTVTSVSGTITDAKIENYGTGGYRCSCKYTATTTATRNYGFYLDDTSKEGVHIWGAQVEAENTSGYNGEYATSYIPTEGSTVTRNAEVCNNAGSSDLINSTEGVLYAEIAALVNDGTIRRISLSDGGTSNRLEIFYGTIANRIDYNIYSGSSFQASGFSLLSNATDFNKIAVKYKENDFALWVNGTEASTDLSGNTPIGLNKLQLQAASGSNDFYGNVRSVAVFKEALTDEELAKITSTTQQEVFYEMRDRMLQIDADYYEFGDYTTRLKKLF